MAGTRTAPTIDGIGFSYIAVQVQVIDWTGDKRSDNYKFDVTASDAEIEAFIAAQQLISNASIYAVTKQFVYGSVEDSNNASEEVWEEVGTNLVLQTKNVVGESIRTFVPSISNEVMLENTETIDPTNVNLIAYIAAVVALLPLGYSVVGARFTTRRQMNSQVKI